jgi:HSP20 family protein
MPIIRCRPMRDVNSLHSEINRMFEDLWGTGEGETRTMRNMPPADIVEDKDHFRVTLEVPGLKKEEIKVTLQDHSLIISGEKKRETEEKDKTYHRVERSYGTFVRTFELPSEVDANKINAEFKDGILIITIPKSEESKPKEIQVQVN